jgi:GNAT superfamily N-acetyltransferase
MADPSLVRAGEPGDEALVARVGAAAFHDDPVMGWALPDPSTRPARLRAMFGVPAADMLAGRGTVHVCGDAAVALWRDPSFAHGGPRVVNDEAAAVAFAEFAPDELERLAVLGVAMQATHPHEPHWYLNILATEPHRQGHGLGAAVLAPVLAACDAEGHRAYLESTNPRNLAFYRRMGFVDAAEIDLPGGPSLTAMWREPREEAGP